MSTPNAVDQRASPRKPTHLTTLPTKSTIAQPEVTAAGNMKLGAMPSPEHKLPLHEDIMQLARLGEIGPIQKLFDETKYDVNYKDDEGVTPLHVRQVDL